MTQSEEFKEEFDNFLVHGDIRNPNFEGPFGYDDIRKTAIHFANWQKQQMMKSAIDATCVILPPPDLFKVLICHEVTNKLVNKQKIKILIVKNND